MKLNFFFLLICINLIYEHSAVNVTLPNGFRIGAATASYQIEGAWNVDGKLLNIWDVMTHNHPESIADRSSGDSAANSYENYKRDVQILKETGFSFYRFSISWSRVIKKNLQVNQAGIDYYNKLINELLANDIEPMVTIYHWDLPAYLQDLGGWTNPKIVEYFEVYADALYKHFGDRVRKWITFNEPWVFCRVGYSWGDHAPQIKRDGTANFLCGHHMLLSHAAAYHLYKNKYASEQQGEVGICLDTNFYYPMNENVTQETVDKAIFFKFGWFAESIFGVGGYPKVMRDAIDMKSKNEGWKWSRLPDFTDEQRKSLLGAADFLAINHYTSRLVIPYSMNPGMEDWSSDDDIHADVDPSWERSISDWLYSVPQGLRDMLIWIKEHYNNPRVIISENGWSDAGELDDDGRIKYLKEHISAVVDAVNAGCKVEAFTVWSIIDNFEWARGYTERFGIYHIDFESLNKTRTAKKSALFFKDMLPKRYFELP